MEFCLYSSKTHFKCYELHILLLYIVYIFFSSCTLFNALFIFAFLYIDCRILNWIAFCCFIICCVFFANLVLYLMHLYFCSCVFLLYQILNWIAFLLPHIFYAVHLILYFILFNAFLHTCVFSLSHHISNWIAFLLFAVFYVLSCVFHCKSN